MKFLIKKCKKNVIGILLSLTPLLCFAQNLNSNSKDTLQRVHLQNLAVKSVFKFYPIVRDTFNKFPSKLKIQGIITDFTQGTSCGVLCGSGSLKLKLIKKVKGYPYEDIYLAIPCFNFAGNYLIGKKINLEIKVLTMDNDECYYKEAPMNSINSKGIPFYIPVMATRDIVFE